MPYYSQCTWGHPQSNQQANTLCVLNYGQKGEKFTLRVEKEHINNIDCYTFIRLSLETILNYNPYNQHPVPTLFRQHYPNLVYIFNTEY